MTDLPIQEIRAPLLAALREGKRVVVRAPTGSGKSTQVPQFLLDGDEDGGLIPNGQQVLILQPRRLPTRMLAARVATERNVKLGGEVGYQMRFENITSRDTRIRFVTEGTLLRQMLSDPSLPGVAAILFDEFHERHLQGDITLARALQISATLRPDLLLAVMSATLETGKLVEYLEPCAVIESEGRTHPVEVEYLQRAVDFEYEPVWDLVVEELERVASRTEGDVLVFMPGSYEIQRTINALRASSVGRSFIVLPLYGELPPGEQDAAVARYESRKVIVSTNVAETSLTIDGVRVVIDSGLARIPRFDPHRGINTLLVEKISRASADQRMGRAGRTAPGICIRLWTEREHRERAPQELPEIKRLDLAEVLLTLKGSGVEDVASFPWLEPPDPKAVGRALQLLHDLGALESPSPESGCITAMGKRMLAFPMHPRYARMLIAASELGCVRVAAAIAALTQSRNLLVRGERGATKGRREELLEDGATSDFEVLLRAWRFAVTRNYDLGKCRPLGIHTQAARQVTQLFDQFLALAEKEGLDVSERAVSSEAIAKCILLGFSDQVARRADAGTLRCQMVHGRKGVLARESVVQESPLLVVADVREIEARDGEPATLLGLATPVKEEWLRELFPRDFAQRRAVSFDSVQRRAVAREETIFRDLTLHVGKMVEPTPDEAAALLAEEVTSGRCPLDKWDHAVEQWIVRVNALREWCPESEIPAIGAEDRQLLLEQICLGARSYREAKERSVWPVVKAWLPSSMLGFVDSMAPERIELPNGKKVKISYAAGSPPTISARIQDLYGVEQGLTIAGGRVPVLIQVLAPNHRPVQVTQNLANFWKESYPKLKAELQRKYPRHEWR